MAECLLFPVCGKGVQSTHNPLFFGSLPIVGWIPFTPKVNRTRVHFGKWTETPAFKRTRFRSSLVSTKMRMSIHTAPNKSDYQGKRSRVRLKQTKPLRWERTYVADCSSGLTTHHISCFCWGPPRQDTGRCWLKYAFIEDGIRQADVTSCHDSECVW